MLASKKYPKYPKSAYMFFTSATQSKLMKDKLLSFSEAAKENAEIWKKMSDEEKKPYTALCLEDKTRRENQIQELKSKGYFTLPDGTKSCEDKFKVATKTLKKKADEMKTEEYSPIPN